MTKTKIMPAATVSPTRPIISDNYPEMVMKEVRKSLARCGISSKHAMQPIGTLSGANRQK